MCFSYLNGVWSGSTFLRLAVIFKFQILQKISSFLFDSYSFSFRYLLFIYGYFWFWKFSFPFLGFSLFTPRQIPYH